MEFFKFELRYWIRGFMVYIFLGIIALLFGFATGSDFVQVGEAIGNTYRNAPYVIMEYYIGAGLLAALMVSAIYDSAASRDFATKFSDVLFSKPIGKWNYLVGRFSAATLIALIPSLGISIGMIVAGWVTRMDAERWGPIRWDAHALGMLLFALPNTLLVGSIVFAIAAWTRNTMFSFLGVLLLIVAYLVSQAVLKDINNEFVAMMIDPLGGTPYTILTKYWTVDQRNNWCVPFSGALLLNRAIWLSVGLIVFAFASWRFSFASGRIQQRKASASSPDETLVPSQFTIQEWTKITPQTNWFGQLRSCIHLDAIAVIRNPTFIVVLCAAMLLTSDQSYRYDQRYWPKWYNTNEKCERFTYQFRSISGRCQDK